MTSVLIKRTLDVLFSLIGLLALSPILLICMLLIYLQDFSSPLFLGERIGKNGRPFRMYKLRSMVSNASALGGVSTSADDKRITPVGAFVRKFKLDEIMQLVNVCAGSMSLVGPRPNVLVDTCRYTEVEQKILTIKPGITDFASIVFSDEGEILEGSADPDLEYNRVIRPWKSRLALFYIDNQSTLVDLLLIFITVASVVSRRWALARCAAMLQRLGANDDLIEVTLRQSELVPSAPPGAQDIVTKL